MNENHLVSLPLPMLTAGLCVIVGLLQFRIRWVGLTTRLFFLTLFGSFALESILVGMRFGYNNLNFIWIQRLLPLLAGPLMFLGFVSMTRQAQALARSMAFHLGLTFCAIAVISLAPNALDALEGTVILSYLAYIIALIILWRRGPDQFINVPLAVSSRVMTWLLCGICLLIFILIMDGLIAAEFILKSGNRASTLISFGSFVLIILLVAMIFALPNVPTQTAKRPTETSDLNAQALEANARAFLEETQLYLEADLSIDRLAKRLHVPIRSLSHAINKTQNMNVSQYVNTFRLDYARTLLEETDTSVSQILLQSGFLTRSNFYRAFQERFEQSPTHYRSNMQSQS